MKGVSMRVLVVASVHIFPSRVHQAGSFFARLMDRLADLVEKVCVISPRPWTPRHIPYISGRLAKYNIYPPTDRRGRILVARPRFLPLYLKRHQNLLSGAMACVSRPLARRLHRKYGFDVVLGYSFPSSAYAAIAVGKSLGIPTATFAIGSDINVLPLVSSANLRITRKTVRRSSLVLTDSRALAETVRTYCPEAEHVRPYYMGIDLSFLGESTESRDALRQRYGIGQGEKCLIMIGHIIRTKGIWEFLEAFRILAERYPNLRGLMVGRGVEAEALRAAIRDADLEDHLTLTGLLERVDVGRVIKAADLMLFPTHHEGVPDTVKEALAAELPVVATDVDGNPEVVIHEKTGLLVPKGDVPAMVQAVTRMLEDPGFARRTAVEGRRWVEEVFNADKNVYVLRDILQHLASDPAAGPRIAAET